MGEHDLNRRQFIKTASVVSVAAAAMSVPFISARASDTRFVGKVGENIKLLVRPEDLQLSAPQATVGNRLLGKVTFVRDIGATIETTVECSGISFTALSTPCQGMDLGIGHAVSVTIPAQACRLLGA